MPILFLRNKLPFLIALLSVHVLFFSVLSSTAHSEEGLTWNRFRLSPLLSITEKYSDNIYLSNRERQNDTVTSISPKLSMDFSISPDNYINVEYEGRYSLYGKSDNFKKYIHKTDASWKWTTQKGSVLDIGASINLDSIQPYSPQDNHKDFAEKKLFGETSFEVSPFLDMGISYDHTVRRFDKSIYEVDDFDRDTATLRLLYKRLTDITFTSEYAYFYENNKESLPDLASHVVLIGALWDPSKRLSGYLKSGYYRVNAKGNTSSSGFAMDADVSYRLTDIILLDLVAFRRVVTSVRVAREPGAYYISTGGGLNVSYSGLDNLVFTISSLYRNNKFEAFSSGYEQGRKDNYFNVGLTVKYAIQKYISFITNYQYRINNSTIDNESYTENRIEAQFRFAL